MTNITSKYKESQTERQTRDRGKEKDKYINREKDTDTGNKNLTSEPMKDPADTNATDEIKPKKKFETFFN